LQDKLKAMIRGAKAKGDAKRLKIMTDYVKETGNGPAPPPFSETPADDIGTVGRVDPSLLSGTDPVFDKHSRVTVEAGSIFASGQEQSGVGMSQLAPRFAPRFNKVAPAAATATSGLCATQVSQTAVQPTIIAQYESDAESLVGLELDVSNEHWAHDILNNSGTVVDQFITSTPTRSPTNSLNNTFSTANLTPMRLSTPGRLVTNTSMSPATSQVSRTPPLAYHDRIQRMINDFIAPAVAAIVAPAAAAIAAPAAAAIAAPAAAAIAAPAAAAIAAPAAAAIAAPAAANDNAQQRRQRRNRPAQAVAPPPSVSAYEAMLAEKSRINRIVGAEMIRLAKIEKMASVEASREKALYWKLRRELMANGANVANVSDEYNTVGSSLHTGALSDMLNDQVGERKGILTVMHFFYHRYRTFVKLKFFCYFYCSKKIFLLNNTAISIDFPLPLLIQ
jgi:hypothetical protein